MKANWIIFTVLISLFTLFVKFDTQPSVTKLSWTPTPRPTITPTATPGPSQPTPINLLRSLKSQLFFGGGGGGPPAGALCWTTIDKYKGQLPVILLGEAEPGLGVSELWNLCIYGLPVKDSFQVTVSDPNGKKLSLSTFRKGQTDQDGIAEFSQSAPHPVDYSGNLSTYRGKPLIELRIWLPPDAPTGKWHLQANTTTAIATGEILVRWPASVPALYPAIRIYDPFDTNYENSTGQWVSRVVLTPAKRYSVVGINFPPNRSIPVALYRMTFTSAKLIASAMAVSDAKGHLSVDVTMDAQDPPSVNFLIAVLDLNSESIYDAGPSIDLYSNTCPGAPTSRLMVGDTVQLAYDNATPNRIRSSPGLRGKELGKLMVGQNAVIIDGMVCADQMVWWKIRTSSRLEGWTSEGQGDHTFLELDQ